MHEAKMNRTERGNRQSHNYSWKFQHSSETTLYQCRKKISKSIYIYIWTEPTTNLAKFTLIAHYTQE